MTTIVNTPGNTSDSGSAGGIVMVLVVLVMLVLLVVFGVPMLRRATAVPQVNIPDQIDVNVSTPE